MDKGLYEFLKKYVVEREMKKEMVKEYEEDYKIKVLYIGKHFSIYHCTLKEGHGMERTFREIYLCENGEARIVWKITPDVYRTEEKCHSYLDVAIENTMFFDDVDIDDLNDETYVKLIACLAESCDSECGDDVMVSIAQDWIARECMRLVEEGEIMENKKNQIDNFTVAYCMLAVAVILAFVKIIGIADISWVAFVIAVASPVIFDIVLFISICTISIIKFALLKIKKWIYSKKNGIIEF